MRSWLKDGLVQVSDKLSAHNSGKLASALAAKLKAADWSSDSDKEAMQRALLPLQTNLQQLVFRRLGDLSAPVLFSWPMGMQQVRKSFFTLTATTCAPLPAADADCLSVPILGQACDHETPVHDHAGAVKGSAAVSIWRETCPFRCVQPLG